MPPAAALRPPRVSELHQNADSWGILGAALSLNRSRVLVALLAAGAACANARAQADCHAPRPTLLVERYISADCAACWQSAPPLPAGAAGKGVPFALDWIVPSARGEAAPLSLG